MNVLSLFDGMSCGQIALNRIGIKPDKYFASEIDKYAIKITQKNYPDTIQIGDVTKVSYKDGVLYTENENYNIGDIDLLMGGSPCQGFSNAGKGLNFDDPRSKLFFEFVRILNEIKPTYFLLENVKMKKEWQDIISSYIGVEPLLINSALVSAQNRKRLYWTNIKNIKMPVDAHIFLKDILEDNGIVDTDKSHCIDSYYYKDSNPTQYFEKKSRQLCFLNPPATPSYKCNETQHFNTEKHKALRACAGDKTRGIGIHNDNKYWRQLTPIECERLQTVPDNYTEGVSNTQRYKMLGNGWTVDVICHILKNMVIL